MAENRFHFLTEFFLELDFWLESQTFSSSYYNIDYVCQYDTKTSKL